MIDNNNNKLIKMKKKLYWHEYIEICILLIKYII